MAQEELRQKLEEKQRKSVCAQQQHVQEKAELIQRQMRDYSSHAQAKLQQQQRELRSAQQFGLAQQQKLDEACENACLLRRVALDQVRQKNGEIEKRVERTKILIEFDDQKERFLDEQLKRLSGENDARRQRILQAREQKAADAKQRLELKFQRVEADRLRKEHELQQKQIETYKARKLETNSIAEKLKKVNPIPPTF